MRILVLQIAPDTRGRRVPRFEPQLGTLLSLLTERGHEVTLAGLARFDLEAVKSALARSLPRLIYADISAVCVDAARRTLEYIDRREYLPVVVGGEYGTLEPTAALSLPGVQAAALGEPEATLVTYLERIKDPAIRQIVSGVWLRDELGTAQPPLPPLVEDLDSLPFPQREPFDYGEQVTRSGTLDLAIGRGCPQRCTYCTNAHRAAMVADEGTWTRRRSAENILDEIDALRGDYPASRRVRFLDHTFALDGDWLAEFLGLYTKRCGLPFCCHVRANAADEGMLRMLGEAGCELADVEVISGSNFIRNEIFEMDLSGEQIAATFVGLRAAGIRSRAIVYLGSPYESEASLADTRRLLHGLQPDLVDVRPYYPWPGTAARALSQEQGWLHSRGEQQYQQDRVGIDMPACRPVVVGEFVRRLRRELPDSLDPPWWRRWSLASQRVLGRFLNRGAP